MILLIVWCTVELVKTDGSIKMEYVVKSSYLETEWGEKVSDRDLFDGNHLIWKCKGVCYEVSICGTHSKYEMLLSLNYLKLDQIC